MVGFHALFSNNNQIVGIKNTHSDPVPSSSVCLTSSFVPVTSAALLATSIFFCECIVLFEWIFCLLSAPLTKYIRKSCHANVDLFFFDT